MKQRSLQSKLFIAYLSMACLILFSFAAFFYLFVAGRLQESQISAMNTLNSSFQSQVDSAIQDLDNVSVNINYSNMSKSILDQKFDLNISDDMLSKMSDLFISLSGTELKADQVNLYDFSGYVLQSGLSTMIRKTDDSRSEWIQKALDADGKKIITRPYSTYEYSKSAKYTQWMISVYRSFTNQYRRNVGVVETAKQCKSVFKSIISYRKQNRATAADVYVFNNDGELIYPYDISENDAAAIKPYFDLTDASQTSVALTSPLNGQTEYATRTDSSYTGYSYLTVQPESFILAPVYKMLQILLAVVAAFLLVSVLVSYRLSRSVVRPVKHLKHIIQRMELDTLGQEKITSYPVSVNELEELYQAFQFMSDNLKNSMTELTEAKEQEIKARNMALQTQINPHFLYNTLDSIVWMIEGERYEDAVFMITQLASLFRISLSRGKTIISVEDEIKHAKNYMNIQKIRYKNSFAIDFSIEEEILHCCTVKLVVQPLLENAIYYGVEGMDGEGEIHVKGYRKEDDIYIEVSDNGLGMPQDMVEQLLTDNNRVRKHGSGVGVINVHNRIRLRFGKPYGLEIESMPDEGTTIRIHLPYIPYEPEKLELLENGKMQELKGGKSNEEK